ncbi:MAG: hypothetical protein H0U70_04260 [Tatlockia sp.]|nr:hypothetical protein [Tatlockia sp.]
MNFKLLTVFFLSFLLVSCVSRPPSDVNNICRIFKEYPRWYFDAKDVQHRWRIPIAVQMAIVHQESKFDSRAKPPRKKLLAIIPWKRPSTAFGFSQALGSTWKLYRKSHNGGSYWASRSVFSDALDFIGWYANQAYRIAGIPRDDAYQLYLAYHEGVGGFQRKTYLQKPWLILVARKVKARSEIYKAQLMQCR